MIFLPIKFLKSIVISSKEFPKLNYKRSNKIHNNIWGICLSFPFFFLVPESLKEINRFPLADLQRTTPAFMGRNGTWKVNI